MLPLLSRSSTALLPQLGAAVRTLGSVQLPWDLVKQIHTQQPVCCLTAQQQHCSQLVLASTLQQCWLLPQAIHLPFAVRGITTSTAAYDKKLSDILKLDRLQHETADALEEIWMAFHASSSTHIGTVLSKDEHTVLCARAAASPLFVMPLSKKAGSFQTLLLQWQPPNRLLFTTLDEFKQWGPQAPPHLTVELFEDLKGSHGIVLARGDLVNSQLISAPEARTLLELARAFYRDPAAYQMVYAFNHNPQQFDFQQLCKELGVNTAAAAAAAPPSPAQG